MTSESSANTTLDAIGENPAFPLSTSRGLIDVEEDKIGGRCLPSSGGTEGNYRNRFESWDVCDVTLLTVLSDLVSSVVVP